MSRKDKNIKHHAKQRFKQRLGTTLQKHEHVATVKAIQLNRAEFVRRTSPTRAIFLVAYRGELIQVVYDKRRKLIVTVLPEKGKSKTE